MDYTHVAVEKFTTSATERRWAKCRRWIIAVCVAVLSSAALLRRNVQKKIGVSEGQLNRKLAGEFAFRQDEISRICTLLNIPNTKIGHYFFCPKS